MTYVINTNLTTLDRYPYALLGQVYSVSSTTQSMERVQKSSKHLPAQTVSDFRITATLRMYVQSCERAIEGARARICVNRLGCCWAGLMDTTTCRQNVTRGPTAKWIMRASEHLLCTVHVCTASLFVHACCCSESKCVSLLKQRTNVKRNKTKWNSGRRRRRRSKKKTKKNSSVGRSVVTGFRSIFPFFSLLFPYFFTFRDLHSEWREWLMLVHNKNKSELLSVDKVNAIMFILC